LIQRVLSAVLIDNKFSLSLLKKEKRINEMEFFFKLNKITINEFKRYFIRLREKEFKDEDIKINFDWYEIQGFMKGYMDLIFEYNNKYYIVDWKTNFLPDYSPLFLKKEIISGNYDVQYMIYLAALHMYLSNNLLSYDYDEHFGGIFYLFVRGVNLGADKNKGIFYAKPEKNDLMELIKLF
ncbi:MAG: PD-(D/E)XK nuclease family protein, partial [Desulfobacterales bacterium]|nr:PD-(D/E)XK nuclease family protein [Desulfobacterales bacterium]